MNRSKWDRRIERADVLAAAHPFAAEVLQFYKRIAVFQQALYSQGGETWGNESARSASSLLQQHTKVDLLLPRFAEFLSAVETCAPEPVAAAARELSAQGRGRWEDLLTSFWRAASDFE